MDLPIDFINRTKTLLGEQEFELFYKGLSIASPTSIRINPFKINHFVNEEQVKWCANAYYLKERKQFTFDPLFHAGTYYVQEASSMFLDNVLREYIKEPVTALDLCAAPGGKSTLIRSALPDGSLLFANEYVKNRSQILAENLIKWGKSDVIVTNNSPADYSQFTGLFDFILTDVPCSGEGMFRKDSTAISEWSVQNVVNCQQRQREILNNIWPTLKDGGILVYSTCTYNHEENEDNVMWIAQELGAEVLKVPTSAEWNITGSLTDKSIHAYRFMPHKTIGEGLFMAVLRKKVENGEKSMESNTATCKREKSKNKKDNKKNNIKTLVPAQIKEWIKDNDDFSIEADENTIEAFPKIHLPVYELVKDKLRIIYKGIQIATIKGHNIIPSHPLAMSLSLNRDAFCCIELDYEKAIAYLRKEAVVVDTSYPLGYVLFTYRNTPLGFAKNIGNRTNNLYPQEWRIRSGYPPLEDPTIV